MAQHENFKNTKQKIRKSWNKTEQNKNELENIPIINLNFNSINFNKKITTIPILTNKIESVLPFNKNQSILLEGFPEDMLNMIEPLVIYNIGDGFVPFLINMTLAQAEANGTIKDGDVAMYVQWCYHWFNRIDKKHFLLKIFYGATAQQAVKTPGGYSGIRIPVTTNIYLKIYNQRIYETRN